MNESAVLSLSNQVENEYAAFLNQIKKLEVLQYPTKACYDFLAKLGADAKNNLKIIKKLRRKALSLTGVRSNLKLDIDEIKAIRRRLIQSLTLYLDWVNGAQTRNVPWSFIPAAERISKQIIPNLSPILYCENQYNYRIIWSEKPKKPLQKYCFVSLPRLHRINVLMHTLIGHELFHPRCKQFTTRLERKVGSETASDVSQQYKKLFPEAKLDTLWEQKELARMNNFVMFAWERALHELLCDMFCAEVFGPAALLAMRAYAAFSEWNLLPTPETSFYPPWQYRFEVVWQQAINKDVLQQLWTETFKYDDIRDIAECFKNHLLDFKGQNDLESTKGFDFVSTSTQPPSLVSIAYQKVNELIPDAHAYVALLLPKISAKWSDERVLKQVPKLLIRLQNGIPPNEIPNISLDDKKRKAAYAPEPAELPAVFLCGWMYQVYREKNVQARRRNLLSYDTLSRLLLKACEDSEMLRHP